MKEITRPIFLIGAGLILLACSPKSTENPPVARVNGTPITPQQYREQGFYSPVTLTGLDLNNPEQRTQAAIESELLYQKALKENLMNNSKVHAQVEAVVISELLRSTVFRDQLPPKISDDEVQAFYNANLSKYTQAPMIHYAHILINLPDKQVASALAQKILSDPKLNQADEFAKLAKQYSADSATANFGGDMGSMLVPPLPSASSPAASWQNKLTLAAATIKESGDILPQPVETERGLHIVKLITYQPGGPVPFDRVRPQIMRELELGKLSKLYRAYVDKLKTDAHIDIDQQAVAVAVQEGFINPYSSLPHSGAGPSPGGMPMRSAPTPMPDAPATPAPVIPSAQHP